MEDGAELLEISRLLPKKVEVRRSARGRRPPPPLHTYQPASLRCACVRCAPPLAAGRLCRRQESRMPQLLPTAPNASRAVLKGATAALYLPPHRYTSPIAAAQPLAPSHTLHSSLSLRCRLAAPTATSTGVRRHKSICSLQTLLLHIWHLWLRAELSHALHMLERRLKCSLRLHQLITRSCAAWRILTLRSHIKLRYSMCGSACAPTPLGGVQNDAPPTRIATYGA